MSPVYKWPPRACLLFLTIIPRVYLARYVWRVVSGEWDIDKGAGRHGMHRLGSNFLSQSGLPISTGSIS